MNRKKKTEQIANQVMFVIGVIIVLIFILTLR
jgi:hypothetical protein